MLSASEGRIIYEKNQLYTKDSNAQNPSGSGPFDPEGSQISDRRVAKKNGGGGQKEKTSGFLCCKKKSRVVRPGERPPKRRLPFPWWCRIVAWIVNVAGVFVSIAFIFLYGISWGNEKVAKWLSMVLVGFGSDLFFTSPIKIFLTALLFAMILKRDDDVDETAEVEESPELADDEEWLHPPRRGARKKKNVEFKPPDEAYVRAARELRLKELKMTAVLKEIAGYSFFLGVVFLVAYGNRPSAAFRTQKALKERFVDRVCEWEAIDSDCRRLAIATGGSAFTNIRSMSDVWDYLESGLLPSIRTHPWYNNAPWTEGEGVVADRISKLIGYPTLRQLRVEKDSCDFAPSVRSLFSARDCRAPYSLTDEEKTDFGVGWKQMNVTASKETPWTFVDSDKLESYPSTGRLPSVIYGGGGYVWRLNKKPSTLEQNLKELKAAKWIDEWTRAIFIDFAVYNAQVNLFTSATLLIEFTPAGNVITSSRFDPLLLTYKLEGFYLLVLLATVVYFISMIYFSVKIIRGVKKEGVAFVKNFWNLIEVGINVVSWIAVVNFVYRQLLVEGVKEKFADPRASKQEYINMQWINIINDAYAYCLAFVTFFCTIKYLRLLRFNKKMSLLGALLKHCSADLMAFSLMYSIAFAMFVQVFVLVFGSQLFDFRNLTNASLRMLCVILGKFDFYAMSSASRVLGPILFFVYIVFMVMIIMNVFVTILNESLNEVKAELELQSNEYEIVDFILKKIKSYLGIYDGKDLELSVPRNAPPPPPSLSACDAKIDRFVASILNVYHPEVDDEFQEMMVHLHGLKKMTDAGKNENHVTPNAKNKRISQGVSCDFNWTYEKKKTVSKSIGVSTEFHKF